MYLWIVLDGFTEAGVVVVHNTVHKMFNQISLLTQAL